MKTINATTVYHIIFLAYIAGVLIADILFTLHDTFHDPFISLDLKESLCTFWSILWPIYIIFCSIKCVYSIVSCFYIVPKYYITSYFGKKDFKKE